MSTRKSLIIVPCLTLLIGSTSLSAQTTVGDTPTTAQAVDQRYISWKEHIIDDPETAGFLLSGSDGLVMGDLDLDGFEDIVSVHESDTSYDSSVYTQGFIPPAEGYIRIAFGSSNPDSWTNVTLAEGADAPAIEDAAIADVNGDGYPDVIAAAELSHLIYLQNPGRNARTVPWQKLILPMTIDRGSFIRVFMGDFDGDGKPEVTAANKGAQTPGPEDYAKSTPVSLYKLNGDPLQGQNWTEIELGHYSIPQNSEPIDIDSDGDLDIMVGSRGENRLLWFENLDGSSLQFKEHALGINGTLASGFNLDYVDLSGDGRLDIVGRTSQGLSWMEQPANIDHAWNAYTIGTFAPDSMTGLAIADINGDGHMDVLAGSYSRGPRQGDGNVDKFDALGRIGWFENPGDAKTPWTRHDISRRKRGMFDKFIARDLDNDGDMDFLGTRGNSAPYGGVFWLEQVRTTAPAASFQRARNEDSEEMPLP